MRPWLCGFYAEARRADPIGGLRFTVTLLLPK